MSRNRQPMALIRVGDPDTSQTEQDLAEALLSRLQSLSFVALEECTRQLLSAMGYADAHLVGRVHFKGRNHHGGPDIEAYSAAGVSRFRIVVVVKQYKRPVQKRFVDELAGMMSRLRARHGLLITTSTFPAVAHDAARGRCLAPIRLIDGTELSSLLVQYRIGVRQEYVPRLILDEPFFARLDAKQNK
jgi:restriction endonuclease Mrr